MADVWKNFNSNNEYTGFLCAITPFLLLEYLGQDGPNISIDPIKNDKNNDLGTEAKQKVFHAAHNKYKYLYEVSDQHLRSLNSENLKYLSDKARPLYRDVVERIVNQDGFSAKIQFNLALDFSYRYNYSKTSKDLDVKRINLQGLLDMYRLQKLKENYTQTRAVMMLCKDLSKRFKKKEMSVESKNILAATSGIKEFRDLFDLDLVQLCCLGSFIDDKKYPILMITSDKQNTVIERIRLFKTTLEHFDKRITNTKAFLKEQGQYEKIEFLPGKVVFVNKTSCKIERILDVSSVEVLKEGWLATLLQLLQRLFVRSQL